MIAAISTLIGLSAVPALAEAPLPALDLPPGAPLAGDLQAWSAFAVDARPNLMTGEAYTTAAWRVGLETGLTDSLAVAAIGGVRVRPSGEPYTLRGDLWQGALVHTGARHRVEVGRLVRIDPRGFQRLDGVNVNFDDDHPVRLSAWGGRMWSPLDWKPGGTFVLGTQASYAPDAGRVRAPRQHATVGAEIRSSEAGFHTSLMASGATRSPYGDHASALVEVGLAEHVGVRTDLRASRALAHSLHLGGQLAWNGLPPPNAIDSARSPFDWLVRDAYGLANTTLTWEDGPWRVNAAAGLTGLADRPYSLKLGGQGQLGASRQTGAWRVAGEVRHATIGTSGLAGGAAGVGHDAARVQFRADTGLWRMRSLDSTSHLVWETRAMADLQLFEVDRLDHVQIWTLSGNLGAGTDRQLSPWLRGGLTLRVHAGRAS